MPSGDKIKINKSYLYWNSMYVVVAVTKTCALDCGFH